MKPACKDCHFWERNDEEGNGCCCRFPPVPILHTDEKCARAVWPETEPEDWCGEFSPSSSRKKGKAASPKP